MRHGTRWTAPEHARLVKLVEMGKTNREISSALGRSMDTVHGRVFYHNLRGRPKIHPPIQPAMAHIEKADVPAWYLEGWRFAGFSPAGLCRMERYRSPHPTRTIKSQHRDCVRTQTPCIASQAVCEV